MIHLRNAKRLIISNFGNGLCKKTNSMSSFKNNCVFIWSVQNNNGSKKTSEYFSKSIWDILSCHFSPINQPKNYFNAFQCQFCNHILLTKNGAKKHNCQSFRRDKIIDKYTDRHVMVMHYILRYIATSNIPFRAADSKFLRNAISIFKCVPKLLTIRWDSLFKCVSYIVKHYQQINQNSNLANSIIIQS